MTSKKILLIGAVFLAIGCFFLLIDLTTEPVGIPEKGDGRSTLLENTPSGSGSRQVGIGQPSSGAGEAASGTRKSREFFVENFESIDEAANFAVNQMEAGPARNRAVDLAMTIWLRMEPEQAEIWAQSVGDPELVEIIKNVQQRVGPERLVDDDYLHENRLGVEN